MKIEVLYSPQCTGYLPAFKLVQEVLAETDIIAQSDVFCASNLFGVITTEDGARINFDSMGFFQRHDKGSHV